MNSSPVMKSLPLAAAAFIAAVFATAPAGRASGETRLEAGFASPPDSARLRAYWWWLNSNVTKESITHDLEQMRAKGFGGAVIFDAGGADLRGNDPVPAGPTFSTPAWRELFLHTLREAHRLGLEISLNILSGWDVGGPDVHLDEAIKKLVWSESTVEGGRALVDPLPEPAHPAPFYRDVAVVALPARTDGRRPMLKNLGNKTLERRFGGGVSGTTADIVLADQPDAPGEADSSAGQVVDLTSRLAANGVLAWQPPPGRWTILRMGYTLSGARGKVFNPSNGWAGYAIDPFDRSAFTRYWDTVVEPLIDAAGPLAGTTFKYLHTDSWDVDPTNWTPTLREEFQRRRGYDPLPWYPVVMGKIVNSRSQSDRFLSDFRRTLGDLAVDHHFRVFKEHAHEHGMEIHPESGGPDVAPVDGQECLSVNDVPMGEFWAEHSRGRVTDQARFTIKQPASAAHTFGHRLVNAEGFTNVGLHWQETLFDNLKPSFDYACTEGMNRLFWHAFVCSPDQTGIPGQQYHAGTHLNPKTTWWSRSAPFFTYLNRCQFMLQQGLFVGDVLYYYGDHVPQVGHLRDADPARVGKGYDFDEITEEGVLTRVAVRDGRLVLPDGVSYRLLVLPQRTIISLPVLRRIRELVAEGATVLGPKPETASGLSEFPRSDREVRAIADELWSKPLRSGRVIADRTAREVLEADGVGPDFESAGGSRDAVVRYIHRRQDDADIYFVACHSARSEKLSCVFRVASKVPEVWDPVTGRREIAGEYQAENGRTRVSLSLPPFGSVFVVFRAPAQGEARERRRPAERERLVRDFPGPWEVKFDPKWGGPAHTQFGRLVSWSERPEPGIRYYSGEATYRMAFDAPAARPGETLAIDLGMFRDIAEVRVNHKSLGILWAPPFRLELPRDLKPTGNVLEITVVNAWANRVIGDSGLPAGRRFTRTNIRELTRNTPLMPSGLLGPVRLYAIAAAR